jgi:hypothetical protein
MNVKINNAPKVIENYNLTINFESINNEGKTNYNEIEKLIVDLIAKNKIEIPKELYELLPVLCSDLKTSKSKIIKYLEIANKLTGKNYNIYFQALFALLEAKENNYLKKAISKLKSFFRKK